MRLGFFSNSLNCLASFRRTETVVQFERVKIAFFGVHCVRKVLFDFTTTTADWIWEYIWLVFWTKRIQDNKIQHVFPIWRKSFRFTKFDHGWDQTTLEFIASDAYYTLKLCYTWRTCNKMLLILRPTKHSLFILWCWKEKVPINNLSLEDNANLKTNVVRNEFGFTC